MIKGALTAARLKGALRPLISASIHRVYKPLWAPRTRPQNNQAGYFFLTLKIPQVLLLLIDVNWIPPSSPAVSGFQDSRVIRIWHRQKCWIQHGRLYPFEKKGGVIRCSSFKANQKSLTCRGGWFENGSQTSHFCSCGFLNVLVASVITSLHFHIGLLILKGTSSSFTKACLGGNHLCAVCMCVLYAYLGVCVCIRAFGWVDFIIRPYPPLHHSTPTFVSTVCR